MDRAKREEGGNGMGWEEIGVDLRVVRQTAKQGGVQKVIKAPMANTPSSLQKETFGGHGP